MNALHRARTRDLEGGVPVAETLFLLIPMENEPGRRQALFGRRSVREDDREFSPRPVYATAYAPTTASLAAPMFALAPSRATAEP
jgi:hypothetical protein